jgi:RecA-family ATPase
MSPVYPLPDPLSNGSHKNHKKSSLVPTFKEFVEEADEHDYLVEGLLPDAGWTLLVGIPGVGKSTFAAQLCSALQEGQPFLGMTTRQKRCLYIQCDTPDQLWKQQLKRIAPNCEAWNVRNVPQNVLDSEQYIDTIKRIITVKKPQFIVFDALNTLTGRDINTKHGAGIPITTMTQIARLQTDLNEFTDLPWMLLHHPTKAITRGVNSAAGSGSISGRCATHLTLSETRLRIEKSKVAPKKNMLLGRNPEGLWYIPEDGELADFNIKG